MIKTKITLLLLFSVFYLNAQAFSWDEVEIYHYDIHLSITDISSKQISGYTQVTTVSKVNGLDSMFLYLSELQIDSIHTNGNLNTSFVYDNDSIIKIELPAAYNIGDTFTVTVFYQGQPILDPSGFGGFYFSGDNLYAYNLGVAFSDDPHSYGRVWFPCIDSFTHKSLYDFYITTTTPQFAVCGGTMISKTDDVPGGTTLTHWKMNQKTPPYLISVAVSDFVVVTDTFASVMGNIPIDIYVRQPDSSKVAGSFANLNTLLVGFENHFGPYGWDRVGYVGVPFNYGAMEHAMNIAYPRFAINGFNTYESLLAHELAHSWFGNLVTCTTAPDMWINEGWARFSEIIYREIIYDKETGREYFRSKHRDVLHKTHITDNGYLPVSGVTHDYTYGSTVYDKGGVVTNALRYYIGDSLFFQTVIAYTDSFKYKTISSLELRDFFSWQSGVDLNHFFDTWVFRPGFIAMIVDSFHVEPNGPDFDVTVWFNQKLKGTTEYALSNKFDVLFVGENHETYTHHVFLANPTGNQTFTIPFTPVAMLIDPLDQTVFATTKYDRIFTSAESPNFLHSFCKMTINNPGSDSARLFVRHHWVAPDDDFDISQNIYRISDYRYWEIDGVIPQDADISAEFHYNRTATSNGNLDNNLLPTTASTDSLVLLYRENAAFNWTVINFTRTGNANVGYMVTPKLLPGQYTLGIGEPGQSSINQYEPQKLNTMKVYPNPSNGHFTIELETESPQTSIRIFNSMGRQIENIKPVQGKNSIIWKPNGNPSGMYIIQLHDTRKKVMLDSRSVIYEK